MILIDTQKEEFSKLKEIRIFDKVTNENRFNKDLLVIGLGGVGSRVACTLKGMLMENISHEDNISFLMIDSDIPAMEATIEDSKTGVGFNALEILSIYRQNLDTLLANGIDNNPVHPNLAGWMRKDFPNITIGTDGARGNRQIGRLMFANAYSDIRILLFEKLQELYDKSQTGKLDVIIVSGVAGGTGSGILSDLTYNIRAYAKSRKWTNFRVGGCLLMPDVLFGRKEIYDDKELVTRLNANACATMKEVDRFMHSVENNEPYVMTCMDHRLSIVENIFDVCMLVSGKKDEQGYLPEHKIYSDTAYFLFKLACNKYIGVKDENGKSKLLRDVFFEPTEKGKYKIVNESDYRIPIREIENICEYQVFSTVYERLIAVPVLNYAEELNKQPYFADFREFLMQKPGEEIRLSLNGILRLMHYEKPSYKMIKKGQDNLRSSMATALQRFKEESNGIARGLKTKLIDALEVMLEKYNKELGPFACMEIIGASGIGKCESDCGLICEIKKLGDMHRKYEPTGEFTRIIDSIKDIVAKRFFTFPSAKKETENGYYDACLKEALALERNIFMEALDAEDVFGDIVRWLRQRAERMNEIYYPFGEDLRNSVYELAANARNTVGYLLKDAKQQDFLPSDYITDDRLEYVRRGLIDLMINHESDIDNARVVPVKQEMEKIYRDTFMGIDLYAPEKLISVAFADEMPTLQDTNMMFVTVTSNEKLAEIMKRAAEAFVRGAKAKVDGKKLCILKENWNDKLLYKRYISLPDAMPHFSEAIKKVLISEPYNESEDSISFNAGEIEISVDDMFFDVSLAALSCSDDMQAAYDSLDKDNYFGLHIDEVNRDNRIYPSILDV